MLSDLELLAKVPTYASNVMANTNCTPASVRRGAGLRMAGQGSPFLRTVSAFCNRNTYDTSYYRGKSAFRSSLDKVAIYLLRYCSSTPPGRRTGHCGHQDQADHVQRTHHVRQDGGPPPPAASGSGVPPTPAGQGPHQRGAVPAPARALGPVRLISFRPSSHPPEEGRFHALFPG